MLRLSLSCLVVAVIVSSIRAQAPDPIKLTLTPAKPPTPALRYQLLPDARITISDDAAPLYKQVGELLDKKEFDKKVELFDNWSSLPVDQLPRDDVRKALADYAEAYVLLDKAARCERCDWGLPQILREKGIQASLAEFQRLRTSARLLSLRARLQMADGELDKALATLGNGLALARHIGEHETLIVFLIGTASAGMMEFQLDELIARPGAPNLYYALTDLPTPLIRMRPALEGERLMAYGTFPGLAAIGADLNAGNLTDEQLAACGKVLNSETMFVGVSRTVLAGLILSKKETAKQALIDAGRPRDKVEAMTPVQVALLHSLLEYDAVLDEMLLWEKLPYWELADRQRMLFERVRIDRVKDPKAPALPLAALFVPAALKVSFSRVRIDRKIALLRTIEAIRFYAATHDGNLPPSLAAVKEVPIPLDPVSSRDFIYQLDGDTATLRTLPPGRERPSVSNTVVYEMKMRK